MPAVVGREDTFAAVTPVDERTPAVAHPNAKRSSHARVVPVRWLLSNLRMRPHCLPRIRFLLRALTRERRAGTRREPERTDCNQRTRTGEALARVGERHKVFPVSRPRCATCSPPLRAGAPAARRQADFSSRCDSPTGGELPADPRRAVPSSPGRPT
jgi:hypothetical protein